MNRLSIILSSSLLGGSALAGEAASSEAPKQAFAMGTPLWVLGFAIVIALVFILIPVCAMIFKSGEQV